MNEHVKQTQPFWLPREGPVPEAILPRGITMTGEFLDEAGVSETVNLVYIERSIYARRESVARRQE